ncbi:hypothetical protein Afil01_18690 [Actinorhabdospora filicis]|uniref:Lipoprotein n=1 Tax=Actinorhabdospora filicis TaxID=1785913 RepID=A0A9W6W2I8_9ACTN|nr:hypothetical protein [Actinorhabdospora filicis]GLZ77062.1 hypothetical protein Afil01_18690 [Actinorhabdospora filicis]
MKKTIGSAALAGGLLLAALTGCETGSPAASDPSPQPSAPDKLTSAIAFPQTITLQATDKSGEKTFTLDKGWDESCPKPEEKVAELFKGCEGRVSAGYESADGIRVAIDFYVFPAATGSMDDEILAAKKSKAFDAMPDPLGLDTKLPRTWNATSIKTYMVVCAAGPASAEKLKEREKTAGLFTNPACDWGVNQIKGIFPS